MRGLVTALSSRSFSGTLIFHPLPSNVQQTLYPPLLILAQSQISRKIVLRLKELSPTLTYLLDSTKRKSILAKVKVRGVLEVTVEKADARIAILQKSSNAAMQC